MITSRYFCMRNTHTVWTHQFVPTLASSKISHECHRLGPSIVNFEVQLSNSLSVQRYAANKSISGYINRKYGIFALVERSVICSIDILITLLKVG